MGLGGGTEEVRRLIRDLKTRVLYEMGQSSSLEEEAEALGEALTAIQRELGNCQRCRLHQGRRHLVFGEGNPRAVLMVVGEAPGEEEDLQGRPFVGRAGALLTRMLRAIKLERSEVYITNVIKCRPPENRTPRPDEIATCLPILHRQIQALRPRVILALGGVAAKTLLGRSEGITKLRGRAHRWENIAVVPTYHPAFLLRNPLRKPEAWEDLKLARRLCEAE